MELLGELLGMLLVEKSVDNEAGLDREEPCS